MVLHSAVKRLTTSEESLYWLKYSTCYHSGSHPGSVVPAQILTKLEWLLLPVSSLLRLARQRGIKPPSCAYISSLSFAWLEMAGTNNPLCPMSWEHSPLCRTSHYHLVRQSHITSPKIKSSKSEEVLAGPVPH